MSRPAAKSRLVTIEEPVVITCAISGAMADRRQCPAIPYTPREYAAEARRIVDEGGVHIHIHARRPDGTPSHEIEDFHAIQDAIVDEVGDRAIVNFSTGTVGVPVARRVAYLEACRPEIASLNMGSMNFAKYSREHREFTLSFMFANPLEEIIELLEAMRRLGITPELECYDLGHVGSLEPLLLMGLLEPPLHADVVMGMVGGAPPTPRNLAAMVDNLATVSNGSDYHWGVVDIGPEHWVLVAAALTMGGSVRVGLEDHFYLPGGAMARSNGELVAQAVKMTTELGRRPASVEETRALLGIPRQGSGLAAPCRTGPRESNQRRESNQPRERNPTKMLTYEQARQAVAAALEEASASGTPMSVAVVDAGRNLLALGRQDEALLATTELSVAKARTARSLNMSTADLAPLVQPGGPLYGLPSAVDHGFIPFGGGRPLAIGEEIVGAIGVSGGTADQDDRVAAVGAAAISGAQ
jgi:3-keto-5-aminohexanoate cleavage enzyme